jgi:6-phosphogluconolactonase
MIRVFGDKEELSRAAADQVRRIAQRSIERLGKFTIALSGGSTPRRMYELLADEPLRSQIDWSKVQFFWGDERSVPPDHKDSDFGMARDAMLSKLPIDGAQVHRMRAESADLDAAAADYEAEIARTLGRGVGQVLLGRPRPFDLVLLGLGGDGHTASLFPETAALDETQRWVVKNPVPQLATTRLTLTPPMINAARYVIFVVSGADKSEVLAQVIGGPSDPKKLPAQLIRPFTGEALWFVDRAASAGLLAQRIRAGGVHA